MIRSHLLRALLVAPGLLLALAPATRATTLWTAGSSTSTFKGIEKQDNNNNYGSTNGSTVTHLTDATEGSVWKFHKDDLDRRCEAKGAAGVTINQGSTYYIGWRFKLSSTTNNNSIFQWKSYGSPMVQNYPVVIKMINGQLNFEHYSEGQVKHTLWAHTISANVWYSIVVRVTVSNSASGGTLQFFFGNDTPPETLLTGGTSYTCKTFDGSSIEPKWGYYGETNTNEDVSFSHLKIGTTYNDVKPF
ncbi:MAG TPA: heparin lyase I family protein [Opitutaceae bacterium]|nr:heparin lyase I family protein [Opitutaceae bacterium]